MNNRIYEKCRKPINQSLIKNGQHYGYPFCCVMNFHATGGLADKNDKYRSKYSKSKFYLTGYVPCNKCLYSEHDSLINFINENRLFNMPKFPIDFNYWKEFYYYLFDKKNIDHTDEISIFITLHYDVAKYRQLAMSKNSYYKLLAIYSLNISSEKFNENLLSLNKEDYINNFIKEFINNWLLFNKFGIKDAACLNLAL